MDTIKRLRIWIYGAILLALSGVLLYPLWAPPSRQPNWQSTKSYCRLNHRLTAMAILMYCTDTDGTLPEPKYWMGAITPNMKDISMLECPGREGPLGPHPVRYQLEKNKPETKLYAGTFGHALSTLNPTRKLDELPQGAILTFDSNDPTWNAYSPLTTPMFKNYAGTTTCTVSRVDGSVHFIQEINWPTQIPAENRQTIHLLPQK